MLERRRRRFAAHLLACLLPLLGSCAAPSTKVAPPGNASTVVSGNARFSFLTPGLVRLEYSPTGHFIDAPTAVVRKRDWPAVAVSSHEDHGWLVLSSDAATLRYKPGTGAFTADNLTIQWQARAGMPAHAWHPGDVDAGNLGGLTYSLDNIAKRNLPTDGMDLDSPVDDVIPGIEVLLEKARPGLLSRSGFAFIDDSVSPLWDAGKAWITPRPEGHGQDWYLFTYGEDYHAVLQAYAQLCGPVPMIPRYVLGAWITDFNFEYFPDAAEARTPRFQHYNADRLREEITRFRDNRIPLDGLVLDFAWHNYGWDGGYDFSPLIPHPQALLDWLHQQGVKVSLNDHPGYANTEESALSQQDTHAAAALDALGQPRPTPPGFDLDASRHWQVADATASTTLAGSARLAWHATTPGALHTQASMVKEGSVRWYRSALAVPAAAPATLYLVLGEVGGQYALYVNGKAVAHSVIQWPQRVTYADVSAAVTRGKTNTIVLKVVADRRGGAALGAKIALRDVQPPGRIHFDLSNQHEAEVFMRQLHRPLDASGVDIWWVDGGSGAVDMPGLNKQLWTNKVYYDSSTHDNTQRGFILSRYGDWGSERYPAYFTGDTYSEWPVLAYEVAYTARAGNVLVPYVSHDIGGFHGAKIDFDLYARWVEFGTFSPFLRLHSAHANPAEGNMRMPWVYGDEGMALLRKYFGLRTRLVPYIYTYTWLAHTQSLPILRPLYLQEPANEEAYRHPHEYYFGKDMLVAPVLGADGNVSVYLPPGNWFDFFTGKPFIGGQTLAAHYAVADTPVFVRDGAIVPEQPDSAWSDEKPADRLVLNVYGPGAGRFDLYEDDGKSLLYAEGQHAVTAMVHSHAGGEERLAIGPAVGSFAGQVPARGYEVRIYGGRKPGAVMLDGTAVAGWRWEDGVAVVGVPTRGIGKGTVLTWR
jgi:alpha-glucosidase (family GH31 glycosyl hydrolase)